MSYLFSEAKHAGGADSRSAAAEISPGELPMRARLILTWMLLVELLRKKVDAMWVPAAGTMMGYSTIAVHGAQIVWLGSLVFSSIQNPGRSAVFGVLWSVAAAKMVQRFVITEVIRRSFAAGRNHEIIGAYTRRILEPDLQTTCEFAVTGEENIKRKTGPLGYVILTDDTNISGVVTVGKIRREAHSLPDSAKRLCLSFALFKLLRRRFVDPRPRGIHDNEMETGACRDLIFSAGRDTEPDEVYRVIADEVTFLSEYYYSSVPVVLASPFFFLANFLLFPVTVGLLCLMTVIASGYGDVSGTFHSIRSDNYVLSFGFVRTSVCLLRKVLSSPPALLAAVDLSITFFLFVAYIYEEVCELGVFLLSDWFVVSLVCTYVQLDARHCYCRQALSSARDPVHPICRQEVKGSSAPSAADAARFDKDRLPDTHYAACSDGTQGSQGHRLQVSCTARQQCQTQWRSSHRIGNGVFALSGQYGYLSCVCPSVSRAILTWHIATALLDLKHPPRQKGLAAPAGHRRVATVLSRYCAYLVAFRPELLPDDWNETQHVYRTTVMDLKEMLGCWGYFFLPERGRLEKMLKLGDGGGQRGTGADEEGSVVRNGAILGKKLIDIVVAGDGEGLLKALAELWAQLALPETAHLPSA